MPACMCCMYVLLCGVAWAKRGEIVVNVPIYCGWVIGYMSASASPNT